MSTYSRLQLPRLAALISAALLYPLVIGAQESTPTPSVPPTLTAVPSLTATPTQTPLYGECRLRIEGRVPVSMSGADFDGDGHEDAAFLDSQGTDVLVLLTDALLRAGMCPGDPTPRVVRLAEGAAVALTAIRSTNADTTVDLAVAQSEVGAGFVQNNGGAMFTSGFAIPLQTNADPRAVVAGDFNDDGLRDIAVGTRGTNGCVGIGACAVSILYGNANGFNENVVPISVGVPVDLIGAADLNLDGRLDIVIVSASPQPASVRVLLNKDPVNKEFQFLDAPLGIDVPPNPVALTIADFDGNGIPDIAIVDSEDVPLRLPTPTLASTVTATPTLTPTNTRDTAATPTETPTGTLSTATPTFAPTDTPNPTPTSTRTMIAAGNLEIFVSEATQGSTNFSFRRTDVLPAGSGPSAVAVGFLDDDDNLDAAVTSVGDDRVVFFYGLGDGTFDTSDPCYTDACNDEVVARAGCCVGNGPRAILIAPIDEDALPDSRPDLLIANADGQSFSVLLSSAPPPTPTVTQTPTGTITNTPGPTLTFSPVPPATPRPTATCPPTGICVQGESCAIAAPQSSMAMVWPWLGAAVLWILRKKRG